MDDAELEAKLQKAPHTVHPNGHIENVVSYGERLSENDHKVDEWESFSDYSGSDKDNPKKKGQAPKTEAKVLNEA